MICSSNFAQRILTFTTRTLSTKSAFHFSFTSPKHPPNLQRFTSDDVSETLSCYRNDWKCALDFFHWVERECIFEHTTETYNSMIDILGKFFEFDLSWDLIHRMRKNPYAMPNHVTFRILFKRYVSAHLVSEAISAFDQLQEFSLKDETSFCNLIDALCEYKHVKEAHDLCFGNKHYNIIHKRISADNLTKIHNMILCGWAKISWWFKCREFWEEMDQKGVSKNLHSYSIYMDMLCKSGKPWRAVKLYKEMKSKGIKLDVVAYNTVIRAISLSKGLDFAISVYGEMRELGCQPNVVTCNIVMKLLCENGRVKEAYKILDEMPKIGIVPDVITYHCLFRSLGKPDEILWHFDRMIGLGITPRLDTYVMLMRKFGRWGFLRAVLIVWEKMKELGCSPDEFAYNALIDALVENGMLDMARKYYKEMMVKGLSLKPRAELGAKVV